MDPEEKRQKLERDILTIIVEKLQNGQMDTERAKLIAKMLLDKLHPPLTLEQIYQVAPVLDNEFSELTKAVLPIMQEHDEELRTVTASHAEKLIQSGKIEQAEDLLRKALDK